MFALSVDDRPLALVASDGQAVEPVKGDAILLGWASAPTSCSRPTGPAPYRIVALPLGETGRARRDAALADAPESPMTPALGPVERPRAGRLRGPPHAHGPDTAQPEREIRLDLAQDMSEAVPLDDERPVRTRGGMVEVGNGENVRFVVATDDDVASNAPAPALPA